MGTAVEDKTQDAARKETEGVKDELTVESSKSSKDKVLAEIKAAVAKVSKEHEKTLEESRKEKSGGESTPPADKDKEPDNAGDDDLPAGEEDKDKSGKGGDASDFTPELLDLASKMGFSEKDAKNFGTPANLRTALDGLTKKFAEETFSQMESTDTPPPKEKGKEADKEKGKAGDQDELLKKLDIVFDEKDDLDPATIEKLTKLTTYIAGLEKKIEDGFAVSGKESRRKEEVAWGKRFDGRLNKLGKPFKEIYGEEPDSNNLFRDKEADKPFIETRGTLIRTALLLEKGRGFSEEQAFEQALRMENAELVDKQKREKLKADIKKREKQTITRPSNRETRILSSTDKAIKAVAALRKKKGFD